MTKLLAVLVLFLLPYATYGQKPRTSESPQKSADSEIPADVEGRLLTPTRDWDAADNLNQMLMAVKEQWREQATSLPLSGANGIVGVEFLVRKNGSEIHGSERIVRNSRDAKLGEMALKAIHSATPFEPLPDSYSGKKAKFVILFSYGIHLPGAFPQPHGLVSNGIELITDPEGVNFNEYLRGVCLSVRQKWLENMPPSAVLGDQGINVVEFRILQNGSVPQDFVKMVLKSEKSELDTASLRAIREAGTFSHLPEKFSQPFILLRIMFYYDANPQTL